MRAFALRMRPWVPTRLGIFPTAVAIVLMVGLAVAMAITPTRQLLEQRERVSGMQEELQTLREQNRRLDKRITRLNDPDFLEQQARAIGLARPGETAFFVVPPSKQEPRKRPARRGKARRAKASRPTAAEPSFVDGVLTFIGLP